MTEVEKMIYRNRNSAAYDCYVDLPDNSKAHLYISDHVINRWRERNCLQDFDESASDCVNLVDSFTNLLMNKQLYNATFDAMDGQMIKFKGMEVFTFFQSYIQRGKNDGILEIFIVTYFNPKYNKYEKVFDHADDLIIEY